MTLREQLLSELNQQNAVVQEAISKLQSEQDTDLWIQQTQSGILAGVVSNVSENRIYRAENMKTALQQQNAWVVDMLARYH